MFNSAGYFRAYYCPYFANGLCERPHCHFRHVKDESPTVSLPARVVSTPALSALSLLGSTDKPDLLTLVREAVLQVQKEVEEDRAKLKGSTAKAGVQKQETANSALVLKNGVQSLSASDPGPIEYRPTPIAKLAELKKLQEHNKHGNSSLEYVPESLSSNSASEAPGYKPSLKIPYVPVSKAKQKTNVEYVPSPTVTKSEPQSDSDDEDPGAVGVSRFSSDDDDVKPGNSKTTAVKVEKDDASDSTGSNFDVVNRILTESKLCDSFIKSAASIKQDSKVPAKSEKHISTSKKDTKPKAKKSSDKLEVTKKKDVYCSVKKDKKGETSTQVSKKSTSTSKERDKKEEPSAKTTKPSSSEKSKEKKSKSPSKSGTSSKSAEKTKESVKGILKTVESSDKKTKENKSSKSSTPKEAKTKSDSENKKHSSGTKGTSHKSSKDKKPESKTKSESKNGKIKNADKHIEQSPKGNEDSLAGNHVEPAGPRPAAPAPFEIPKINPEDLDFDLDEHDTYEECLQIFNDYVPTVAPSNSEKNNEDVTSEKSAEQTWSGKKRVAHDSGQAMVKRPKVIAHFQPAPSLVMQTRFIELQKMMQQAVQTNMATEKQNPIQPSSSFLSTVALNSSSSKKRIAHVPNVAALLNPNRLLASANSRASTNIEATTNSASTSSNSFQHTITKGIKRVAHMPSITTLKRPIVPPEFGSRVPNTIRQRYLNLIIDECLKIYDTEQDAFDRGMAEEKNSYDRSSTKTVYLNVVANTIKRLRCEQEGILPVSPAVETKPSTSKPSIAIKKTSSLLAHSTKPLLSHAAILGGKKAANTSFSIHKHKQAETTLTGATFYKALQAYVLTTAQLEENGFPMPHPTDRNKAVIVKQEAKKKKRPHSLEKICCRCGTSFKVTPKGVYLTKDECFYHWGRSYKFRSNGVMETRYSCCQGGHGSEKCSVAKLHVYDEVDYDNLHGYVKLLPKSPPIDGNFGVFSLDCEMCYTGFGMELTRLTVIRQDLDVVYETLVKPEHPIVDYNTRFSGLKDGDFDYVTTTLRDVQAVMMSLCNDKTVLIGHSLESDLKMLKLIHSTVVDTSVVFPHRLGPPFKRALRNLSSEILKKIIQNSDTSAIDGHDSKEDAVACMELMLLRVKEDMKKIS